MELTKYPRTRHLEGSRLQAGDLPDDQPIADLAGKLLVVEEKLDGANCAVSFDRSGGLRLQSRGHYLGGGYRERHFDLLKTWGSVHAPRLWQALGSRYIMYGEWLYAKHTVFYDALPHFFLEFDIYDRESELFLSTDLRREKLKGLPVMPVPVIHRGELSSVAQVEGLIGPSLYKTPHWREALRVSAEASGNRLEMVGRQTEDTDLAEGLYVKQEDVSTVKGRYKFVRSGFLQTITSSEGHWHSRPVLPNKLAPDVDIFAPVLGLKGAYDEV